MQILLIPENFSLSIYLEKESRKLQKQKKSRNQSSTPINKQMDKTMYRLDGHMS